MSATTLDTMTKPSNESAAVRWLALLRSEPLFAASALIIALMIPPTLLAMALDDRTFNGASVWLKPLKFEVSLSLYLATLALFATWLPSGITRARWYRVYAIVVVAAIAAELAWIVGAAAHGIASHFNVADPVMGAIYSLMGILAVILTSASAVYGWLILRNAKSPLAPAIRWSIGLGSILTFVLTVIVAGYMASGTGHTVGNDGDLRIAHFIATHAMHILPVVGVLIAYTMPVGLGVAAVVATSICYVGFVAIAFTEALAGLPFLGLTARLFGFQ